VDSQVDLVRNITRSNPAGILLAALDSKGLIPPVEDADKAGVPVVMVDSGIDSDIPKASITTDNYKGGYLAGLQIAKLLGEKGWWQTWASRPARSVLSAALGSTMQSPSIQT